MKMKEIKGEAVIKKVVEGVVEPVKEGGNVEVKKDKVEITKVDWS